MPTHSDYRIGWICALSLELAAAEAMLDRAHEPLPNRVEDHNTYVLGSIGNHNIVIACLPSGVYGATSATAAAIYMRNSFPSLRFCLMVGIAGGAPTPKADIRLGDVVVSKPTPGNGGVMQYDYGKSLMGEFRVTGSLDKPPPVLLTAIARLEARHHLYGSKIPHANAALFQSFGERSERFLSPGPEHDLLFISGYEHVQDHQDRCDACDRSMLQTRLPRRSLEPSIFYGLVASANQVLRNSTSRDALSRQHGILCFEMEAAGLMPVLPCLVIRGISDYCDSHKTKQWQGYAAINAAAYAKELLAVIPFHEVTHTPAVDPSTSYTHSTNHSQPQHLQLTFSSSDPISSLNLDSPNSPGRPSSRNQGRKALQTLEVARNNRRKHRSQSSRSPDTGKASRYDHENASAYPLTESIQRGASKGMGVSTNGSSELPPQDYHLTDTGYHSQALAWSQTSPPIAQSNIFAATYAPPRDRHRSNPNFVKGNTPQHLASSDCTSAARSRLIIGIDIGTKHTRVAYAALTNTLPEVVPIVHWPDHEGHTDKVPTKATIGIRPPQWGYGSTLLDDSSPLPWLWAILVNDPSFDGILASRDIFTAGVLEEARSLGPKVVACHALGDFLGPLWAYTKSVICANIGKNTFIDAAIHLVVALPTVWAEIGDRAFVQAANLAGIIGSPRTTLRLMRRTAAAAQAALFESAVSSKLGHSYIVCYAGGTSIDVATYTELATHSKSWIGTVRMNKDIGYGWQMTGGDDVDSAFRALLRQHAGRMHYTLDESLLQTILNIEWKDDIKQNFRGRENRSESHSISVSSVEPFVSLAVRPHT